MGLSRSQINSPAITGKPEGTCPYCGQPIIRSTPRKQSTCGREQCKTEQGMEGQAKKRLRNELYAARGEAAQMQRAESFDLVWAEGLKTFDRYPELVSWFHSRRATGRNRIYLLADGAVELVLRELRLEKRDGNRKES